MTTEQFTYWLQGFFEISDTKTLNAKQVQIIKDHLALVFDKVTPDRNKQEIINKLPDGFILNPTSGLLDDFNSSPKLCDSALDLDDEKSNLFCAKSPESEKEMRIIPKPHIKRVYCSSNKDRLVC